MSFKPMLAGKCSDVKKLKFPVMASLKLDGVRCLVIDGKLMSRTLKFIPNEAVQKVFKGLPAGTDGELIVGDPTDKAAYRNTVSLVMGHESNIDGLNYYAFDNFYSPGGFAQRYRVVEKMHRVYPHVIALEHRIVKNVTELNAFEEEAVDAGHEGVMVRSLDGPYKQGRSSEKQGFLLKIKRFEDAEAKIVGFEERMHNSNTAITNALGHTERSTAQAGLVGRDDLGALIVEGINGAYTGVQFKVGTGYDDSERKSIWENRLGHIGHIIKYSYFPLGSKDRPRFPTWLGFRDERDV